MLGMHDKKSVQYSAVQHSTAQYPLYRGHASTVQEEEKGEHAAVGSGGERTTTRKKKKLEIRLV